ncbi:hypothetical protein CARUB_v10007404mg [Capsella rubella]|uniref:Neprosin PEP catalytic domain-containing protein n=1 Tax=Capsella rubella TaxID=81985 RepID=R0H298_9BRAS|nr:uncharacterized protein LOC17880857 [Capsella rubella]EOA18790.1 hypothetical protein CARUB_v10007404mg [Capsella rubella]
MKVPVTWVFLMCCIFGCLSIIHNNEFAEAKRFSKFEDLEIEKRLKAMNKPVVKIIKTIDGEKYGCVDFFKQPAFDHPSMKNHTYHYKMRPIWKRMMIEKKTNNSGFGYLWENGVGCPIGTVPIKRVTKEDLLRLDSFGDDYKPSGSWNTTADDPNDVLNYKTHHYAVARSIDPEQRLNGATMELCIAAPKVAPTQFSTSRLHIQMGKEFIQTGFTVNPGLYKDHKPRTFVYTNAGGKSCYNSNCDVGIMLVRQDFPLGTALTPVSVRGDKISHYGIFGLIKDQKNGNWWLQFGDQGEEVGFWPSTRFREHYGNLVEWGGEVYSASLPSPEMGYGYFPKEEEAYDVYMKRISVLDDGYNVDRSVDYLQQFSDDERGYRVIDDTKISKYPRAGHIVFFGGPGKI